MLEIEVAIGGTRRTVQRTEMSGNLVRRRKKTYVSASFKVAPYRAA